ncbi:proline-rich protein PRCC-like isoform X2 [Acanthaster planci]|uniref:Proline-rich protein PRCC-like isoform X2 n=1 Tax=Acanthaster planci TaxID=133434 RepID=A0A8B7ZKX0_ACAPL|nr:proline-rich protein PRCC-like isoform X2 [Acanthaster planci]
MSLVNYNSSSDDETSNAEEETEEQSNVGKRAEEASSSTLMNLSDLEEDPRSKSSLFSSLPAPKLLDIHQPEETDDIQFPATASTTSSSSSSTGRSLNLPAPKKKSAQPIKITAPSLPETHSDDDEEEPLAKKARPAKGLSGLFAMLPKPRNASLRETNRILLPHTLTKKPAPSKPAANPTANKVPSSQPAPARSKLSGLATSYGSDGDDEDEASTSSFFSFGDTSQAEPVRPKTTVTKSEMPDLSKAKPQPISAAVGPSQSKLAPTSLTPTNPDSTAKLSSTNFGPSLSQDSPITFKLTDAPSGQDAPLAFSKPVDSSAQYAYQTHQYADSQMYPPSYGYGYTEYNQPYQEQDPSMYSEMQGVTSEGQQGAGESTDLTTDKEFQRLMGKRNVGRESVNVVNVAADDVIGPTSHLDWLKKNLTEEKEYRAKLRKEQLPTGQQRRKHQITFLAHQAKERELELKNQWANNRQTRKDTQMKYGF